MINSSELRLGNLVDVLNESGVISPDTGYNWMVVEILENGVNVRPFSEPTDPKEFYTFDRLSPITLTEEWLLKLGFDKDGLIRIGLDTSAEYLQITKNGDVLIYNSNQGFVCLGSKEYVHQVQNLFKALKNRNLLLNREYDRGKSI